MKDKIFGVLQRVGRSFMLPIALLPVAGLLLGIGSSFTNETTLSAYNLNSIIYQGGILYTVLDIMSKAGGVIFDNLALLFAMGVAIGMAKKEKEVAALSGAVSYLIMNTAINTLIFAKGGVSAMAENSTAQVLGITTLQMGVFGGIIVGLGVAALHNRFYQIRLPQAISFFGGTRFVPIISSLVYLVVGIILFFLWPVVQLGISKLGQLVLNSGYAGTMIYGIIERALIPFGLHHVFYIPFWQTAVGGSAIIDGQLIQGAQNIFFAELASKSVSHFSVSATRFMTGKFPFMIFGLPGAAFAMYHCSLPEKKKTAGSLLLSAALTSFLTGITEPLEFTFLFVAPLMYVVHCVLAGLSFMLMHIFGVAVGMTFSGGLIDMILFGILQGNEKTNWIWIVLIGILYFALYYFVFKFLILKFNFKTPGRESPSEETKLYTRADMKKTNSKSNSDKQNALILSGLGGAENISDLDCCATRLRITVFNKDKISDDILRQSGASGVIKNGNGVQLIFGPGVSVIKSSLENYIEQSPSDSKSYAKYYQLSAHMNGDLVSLSDVNDEAFSSGVLGSGIAIIPSDGRLFSPCDGIIENLTETHHAVGLSTSFGAEILLHIGIDTVKLSGKYFTPHVKNGQKVKKGELLITFDLEAIKKEGYDPVTPLLICNSSDFRELEQKAFGKIKAKTDIIRLIK